MHCSVCTGILEDNWKTSDNICALVMAKTVQKMVIKHSAL